VNEPDGRARETKENMAKTKQELNITKLIDVTEPRSECKRGWLFVSM